MIYEQYLLVEEEVANEIITQNSTTTGASDRGDVIFDEEIAFENNNYVAIQTLHGNDGVWTQMVLFDKDGCEIACSEVSDFLGKYHIKYQEDEYIVNVEILKVVDK